MPVHGSVRVSEVLPSTLAMIAVRFWICSVSPGRKAAVSNMVPVPVTVVEPAASVIVPVT
ncbi:hypothetical protein F9K88_07370 [Brucella intermedia]|nr:hypothetical protein F9K88_07370 [Brucella intermedia]